MRMVRRSGGLAVWAFLVGGCAYIHPQPQIITKTDTVTVTKEVAAPLPNGDTTTICLGNGMPVTIRVAGKDTLIGESRTKLDDVRPALDFAGNYFTSPADSITFEKRKYVRQGAPVLHACDELKEVGMYDGVSIFAVVDAPNNLPVIMLPVRPSYFQHYVPVVARKRR